MRWRIAAPRWTRTPKASVREKVKRLVSRFPIYEG